jgi:hypothetical protein
MEAARCRESSANGNPEANTAAPHINNQPTTPTTDMILIDNLSLKWAYSSNKAINCWSSAFANAILQPGGDVLGSFIWTTSDEFENDGIWGFSAQQHCVGSTHLRDNILESIPSRSDNRRSSYP